MYLPNLLSFSRGHTVRAVCESFQLSKDAGFKVVAHMMPDLPNVGMERDVEQFIVSTSWISVILLHSPIKSITKHNVKMAKWLSMSAIMESFYILVILLFYWSKLFGVQYINSSPKNEHSVLLQPFSSCCSKPVWLSFVGCLETQLK